MNAGAWLKSKATSASCRTRTYEEGAEVLRQLMGAQFPKLTNEQWLGAAQRTWHLKHGGLKPAYDLGIARALAGMDIDRPMPPLWHEFDALAGVPMLVIRGANSDLLSAETVAAMRARRADMDIIEVADQGHAPLLEGQLVRQIVRFVETCEGAGKTPRPHRPKRWPATRNAREPLCSLLHSATRCQPTIERRRPSSSLLQCRSLPAGLIIEPPGRLWLLSAVEYISGEPDIAEPPSDPGVPLGAPAPRSV